jgi:hypothetical protein
MPRNPNELEQYVHWLRNIEGNNSLTDAWENELYFEIVGKKQLSCRSMGKDGVLYSTDDIHIIRDID